MKLVSLLSNFVSNFTLIPTSTHHFTPTTIRKTCFIESTIQDLGNSSSIAMAPLVRMFPASSLPDHVNSINKNFREKRRKGDPIDLTQCPLYEMVQYSCNPPQDGVPEPGVVVCKPIVRLFRKYVAGIRDLRNTDQELTGNRVVAGVQAD